MLANKEGQSTRTQGLDSQSLHAYFHESAKSDNPDSS